MGTYRGQGLPSFFGPLLGIVIATSRCSTSRPTTAVATEVPEQEPTPPEPARNNFV